MGAVRHARLSNDFSKPPITNSKKHHDMPRLKQFLALSLVLTAAALGLSLSACSSQSTATGTSTARHSQTAPATQQSSAISVTDKVCIDPTNSSVPGFSEGVRHDVVGVLATWVPPIPSNAPTAAVAAVPALTMWVREVMTNSYNTDQLALELTIPGTPALPAPPNMNDPNLPSDQLSWTARELRWANAVKAAQAAAATAVAQLRRYHLEDTAGNWSAISGCIAALANQGEKDASVRFLAATDLKENRPPVSANYDGAGFLIDQSCPDGAAACTARANRWQVRLQRQGAGLVSFVRADAAAAAIRSWLLGGRS